jgi:hypothetical protein
MKFTGISRLELEELAKKFCNARLIQVIEKRDDKNWGIFFNLAPIEDSRVYRVVVKSWLKIDYQDEICQHGIALFIQQVLLKYRLAKLITEPRLKDIDCTCLVIAEDNKKRMELIK